MKSAGAGADLPAPSHYPGRPSHIPFVVLAAIACSAPLLLIAWKVSALAVNVPFSDQWEFVLFVQEFHASTLSFGDFWAQHGEQRIFFPRLIMMGLAALTDWDVRWEFGVNLVLAAGIYAALSLLAWRTFAPSLKQWVPVVLIALSVLVFSPIQWEDWLWGWQISWFLSILGAVAAIATLSLWPAERPGWLGVTLAAAAATVGHLSLTSGGLVWAAALPIFVFRKHLRKWVWLWLGLGALVWGVYLIDYVRPPRLGDPGLYRPSRYLSYVLFYLARPFLREGHIIRVGLSLVALFSASAAYLLIFRREQSERAAPWVALGLYAGIAAAATSLNRAGLGLWQAGSSRYTTMATLFAIATAALLVLAVPAEWSFRGRRVSFGVVVPAVVVWGFLAGAYLAKYPAELRAMESWAVERMEIKRCLVRAETVADPCLAKAYPVPAVIFERAQVLERTDWGGF